MLGYLDRIGTRQAVVRGRRCALAGAAPTVARVDLYDLSDSARLATVTADTFPLPPPAGGGQAAAWSCHPGAPLTDDAAAPPGL